MKEKIRLSPSRLKKYEDCSMLYYVNYHTRFPKSVNSGAARGSVVHYILECLLASRRKHYVDKIIEFKDPFIIPSVKRLIIIHYRKLDILKEEDIPLIKEFILVALNTDFYCEGAQEVIGEQVLTLETDKYKVISILDKIAVYDNCVKITDYKSSKAKFLAKDLDFNYQNLFYVMMAKEKWPHLPVSLTFQFLKFKREPNQPAPAVTEAQLEGFKEYLDHMAEFLSDFTIQKATSNVAKGSYERSWMCGRGGLDTVKKDGSDGYQCAAKFPRTYFCLHDDKDKFIQSSFSKKDLDKLLKVGYSIKTETWPGCSAWKYLWQEK